MRWLRCLFTAKAGLLALALLGGPVHAQNSICPTAPVGDSSNRCASTAFVQNQIVSGLPLSNTFVFVGNASNIAVGVPISGDCTITSLGILTCTKLNGVAPGTLYPLNAAPAGTLTGSTLNSTVTVSSLTSVGTLTGGATGAGFTVNLSTSTISGSLPAGNFPALTGDITTPGGSLATTLATVNGNVGSFGGVNSIPSFTVNGKGLITAAGANTPSIPLSELSSAGTTRAGDVPFWNGSGWVTQPGNNSGTNIFTENGSGVPAFSTPQALAGTITTPKILRFAATTTTFTTDATATLLEVWQAGGGGGGAGNTNTNAIPYPQYGFIGQPSAFGADNFTVTINNTAGASPATITGTAINATCNQPHFLTTTGTLPSPFAINTTYYTGCPPDLTLTANTLVASPIQFAAPLTCAVNAARCQGNSTINTTTAGSGVHTLHLYHSVAQGGSGGGLVGDQAVPGSYLNCDGVAGYGLQGSVGQNQYGINVTGGMGGGTPFGGNGGGGAGSGGINNTGGGGGGANPSLTSSAGGGGAGGGYCYLVFRNTAATTYNMTCGLGGVAGPAQAVTVTMTIAAPAVFTLTAHGMGPNASFTLTNNGDTLPTGLAFATTYYVNPETITANTFEVAASPYGTVITTTGSQSGTHILASGQAGGPGGNGTCITKQSYGVN